MAALVNHLGEGVALAALSFLNLLYPSGTPQTSITRLAEACESEPVDLAAIPLASYKGLKAPFQNWAFIAGICQRVGRALLKRELTGGLPGALDATFQKDKS